MGFVEAGLRGAIQNPWLETYNLTDTYSQGSMLLYLDEHIPSAVAAGLRHRGVDVLTVQEAGRAGLPDPEQLRFALSEQRVLVTMDSDFLILASQDAPHAGIAYASSRISIGEMIRAVVLLCDVLSSADMTNHVEFL